MGEMRNTIFWSENLQEKDYSEDLRVDGRIILGRILVVHRGNLWAGFIWLRIGTGVGSYEHGNESSVSLKGGEYFG
jgi:hypothetical protein